MNQQFLTLILALYSFTVWGRITPKIAIPDGFNKKSFIASSIERGGFNGYNQSLGSDCGDVNFKDFTPESYRSRMDDKNNPVYPGITLWYCDIEGNVKEDGYGPGRLLPEKVYFDEKSETWKKKKFHLSREETKESLRRYGISNINDLHPVVLYNIESSNARGYAVIDSNIPREDKASGVKGKTISFCLIHDGNALCGSGPMIYTFDGKDVDFSPYMLKCLETIEMGLSEK